MIKIHNPFTALQGSKCFGCSDHNDIGLQMEFFEDGDYVVSNWTPKQHFAGYGNVLHGGIQSTLMDEIASWVVYLKAKTAGVTATLEVKYKSAVFTDKGPILVRAKLKEQNKRFAVIHTEIINDQGVLCAEGSVKYFIFPLEVAKKKYNYPGYEAFYK